MHIPLITKIKYRAELRSTICTEYTRQRYILSVFQVKTGWKEYDLVKYQINSTIIQTIENSCNSPKIHKIPLGYVKEPSNNLLLKSILLELRGFSDCELDRFPQPGINIHYIYEDLDFLNIAILFRSENQYN